MKYLDRQKKRQSVCNRAMRRELHEIRLMHERAVLNNFGLYEKNVKMYKQMMEDGFDASKLDTNEKKTYAACQKFIMVNDYQSLKELELERNKIRDELNVESDEQEYERLRKKLRELSKECDEFKRKLNETNEGRQNFRLCVGLERLAMRE
jgi:hypothetical protein